MPSASAGPGIGRYGGDDDDERGVAVCYTRINLQYGGAMTGPDRVTRFAADLVDDAAVEGARQSRSAKQQLDHWARVGREVSMRHTAARRRVEAALAGTLPLAALSAEEREVANAELDISIEERAAGLSFGRQLAAEGVTTVALDEHGQLMEYQPDGRVTPLTTASM